MLRIKLLANWDISDLWKMTPNGDGIWKDYNFNPSESNCYDYVLVLNHPSFSVNVSAPSTHIWALMQEPYVPGRQEYMMHSHDLYSKVFTHYLPSDNPKYVKCPPLIPWHVNKTYDELKSMKAPEKKYNISCVASSKKIYPGHKKRFSYVQNLKKSSEIEFDLFGKGQNYIEDKWDALDPYKYSIAIENTSKKDYWTEKIADCFLSYTVPFYYGCTNIEEYFPKDSYLWIDITNPEESIEIISQHILEDDWEKRLPALEEARKLVLEKYQFFPFISSLIERYGTQPSVYEDILIKKYQYITLRNIVRYINRKMQGIS